MDAPLIPVDLHAEYRSLPLGIDCAAPRLGWALRGGGRDAVQAAWRVQVGLAPGAGDCWDSGRVAGDAQIGLVYAGCPLQDRTRYWWRVQVWDGAGREGPWSEPAWFETAFLDPGGFRGDWLGARPIADDERHPLAAAAWIRPDAACAQPLICYAAEVALPDGAVVEQAWLHLLADGSPAPWVDQIGSTLAVNGARPDCGGCPPATGTLTYDVARWLRPGANRIAVKTVRRDDGAFIALLEVRLADGRGIVHGTGTHPWCWRGGERADQDWDAADGAPWMAPAAVGAFGAGPWPQDDLRNRSDRMVPALMLRHDLPVRRRLLRARAYATACGVYQLAIDGRPVGDRLFAPGWTDYRTRVHYQTYDLTALLAEGGHELTATIADGWWSGHLGIPFGTCFYGTERSLKLAVHLDYADGTGEVLSTADPGWQAGTGPVRRADLMDGQTTDAGRSPGSWRPAQAMSPPGGRLQAQPDEPVRELLELPARSLTLRPDGRVIVDFGQNLVGAVRLRLRVPRGTVVRVRHGEVLDRSGGLFTDNLRGALATDVAVCSGGDDDLRPAFTFHGFRYAEIAGLPGAIASHQVSALVYGSDTPARGSFACDDPLLNRLQENIRWGQRGNFLSIPMDCPQRDERLGWTADTQVFAPTAAFNADCAAFYRKYVADLIDAQNPETGAFPDFAPAEVRHQRGKFGWADAGVIIPWLLWRTYGDLDTARQAWPAMRLYLDQRDRSAVGDLNDDWSFGDWVSPPPQTPNAVLNPVYHAWMHRLMAELAGALGRDGDARHHRARFDAVAGAWRRRYLGDDGGIAASDTQAAYSCAIRAGVIPPTLLDGAARRLVAAVARSDGHLNTGFLGTACLLPALSQAGCDATAWQVLGSETFPGWLHSVRNGATTMWERWDSYDPQLGPSNIGGMNSLNHYAFGAVGAWMYARIAGIDRAEDDVAFQRLVVRPVPSARCRAAAGAFRSVRGDISTRWSVVDGRFALQVEVPPNCSAEVHVPAAAPGSLRHDGARFLREQAGCAVFAVGSGRWSFGSRL